MQPPASSPQPLPPLAIIGASTRSAAASALRAGFQPLTADLFADADLRRFATATRISPYPEGFVDWMRTVEPPSWIFTGAMENHPELVDQLAWIAPLWGNPGDVLTRVRDPRELEYVLRSAGLLFPETRYSAAGLPLDGSWLEKTYRGASGSGVRELSKEHGAGSTEKTNSLLSAPCSLPPACYQRRIPGTPCAAVLVAAEGTAMLLGVTRQLIGHDWLGAHGFQYAGSIGPWLVNDAARATVEQIGNVLAEHFELSGLFGVDFILDSDNQVWTIEVNPRYTASVEIVERMTGVRAIAAHVTACNGLRIADCGLRIEENSKSAIVEAHGKATLFARRDVTITDQFAEYTLAEALRIPWPTLADISPAGSLVEAGRPVLTLFAEGRSVEEVEHHLRSRVQELEAGLYTNAF
jgi:predicted ATP-grasp superfamily ATP-dependent carboligase